MLGEGPWRWRLPARRWGYGRSSGDPQTHACKQNSVCDPPRLQAGRARRGVPSRPVLR